MRALFSGMAGGQPGGLPSIAPGLTPPGINTPTGQPSDPFSAMLAQMANQSSGGGLSDGSSLLNPLAFPPGAGAGGMPNPMMQSVNPPAPKTLLHKILPLIHAISVIFLLGFFIVRGEPTAYNGVPEPMTQTFWNRWSSLARYKSDQGGVQAVPVFYAFTTLQLVLHSIRIYYEPAPQPPSGILGMIIPNLPPPFPSLVSTGLKYVRMGGAILDDLCVLLFAVGVVVWGAGLAVP